MPRTILLLLAGAALGAAAAYFTFRADSSQAPPVPTASLAPADDTRGGITPPDAPPPEASAGDDRAALEARIGRVAAEPPTASRALRLTQLLLRLAEIDRGAAARSSAAAGAEASLTRLLFTAWAEQEPDAALAELGNLFGAVDSLGIALEMLRTLGNDESTATRIAASLPSGARSTFLAEAAVARAATAPLAAFRQALATDDAQTRTLALGRIARLWAERDPRQALLQLGEIPNGQERTAFRDAVLATWSQTDPVAVLDYAADLEPAAQERLVAGLIHQVPTSEADAVLALIGRFPTPTATALGHSLIQRVAQTDPARALELLATLPPAAQAQVRGTIAYSYAANDPQAAFAWADSLQPRDPQAVMSVVSAIAQTDPDRALELALTLRSPAEREQIVGVVASIGARGGQQAERAMSRVLALDEPGLRQRAAMAVLGSWSGTEPERAFDWLLANQDRMPPGAFEQVGMQLAMRDPDKAAAYLPRVPRDARPSWLASVASAYAQRDPQAALAWLAQHRGDPAYAQAIEPVASQLAHRDAPAALRLLEESGALDTSNPGMTMNIVMSWAQQDPPAAAAWAMNLGDPRLRMGAVSMAVQQWSARDPDGARRWAFALPPGDARDDALVGLANSPFASVTPDEEVLGAISSTVARDRALAQTAMRLASAGEMDQARLLVEQRISDPTMRERALGALHQVRGLTPSPLYAPPVGVRNGIAPVPGGIHVPGMRVVAPAMQGVRIVPPPQQAIGEPAR